MLQSVIPRLDSVFVYQKPYTYRQVINTIEKSGINLSKYSFTFPTCSPCCISSGGFHYNNKPRYSGIDIYLAGSIDSLRWANARTRGLELPDIFFAAAYNYRVEYVDVYELDLTTNILMERVYTFTPFDSTKTPHFNDRW